MHESQQLIKNCRSIRVAHFTDDLLDRVKYFLLDYLGVGLRGSQTESSQAARKGLHRAHSHDQSQGVTILGTPFRAAPSQAALLNGTAAHSLELDDVVNAASLHPGVVIMPAVLAAAEWENSSAGEVFEAIVTGYEVMVRLGIALNPAAHYKQGFHPTGTCGAFGAAMAVGKILHLDQAQMANALGIAGSQAAGSLEFLSDGAYTKRFHAGWAAHSGLLAAFLAQAGFTGPASILEGRHGFFKAYSPASNPEALLQDWANPFALLRTSIKPHACCRYKQGPIDGILHIMQERNLRAEDVEWVRAGVLDAGYALVAEPLEAKQHPQKIVDAQFSMPFGAAVAMHFGKAGLDQYTEEVMQMPIIQNLMQRVSCERNPKLDREFPEKWPASVTLKTKQGQTFSAWVDYPKGDPENPLNWDELVEKFQDLCSPVLDHPQRKNLTEAVQSLKATDSITQLWKIL
jgi:2-methylcitrate dehydratase PrpD